MPLIGSGPAGVVGRCPSLTVQVRHQTGGSGSSDRFGRGARDSPGLHLNDVLKARAKTTVIQRAKSGNRAQLLALAEHLASAA